MAAADLLSAQFLASWADWSDRDVENVLDVDFEDMLRGFGVGQGVASGVAPASKSRVRDSGQPSGGTERSR